MARPKKPIVVVTGAAGSIGGALAGELSSDYHVVGLDQEGKEAACPLIPVDLTSDASVEEAMARFARGYGRKIAAVVHLAAYFDFTGEENELYREVNVEGTRRLLRALQDFEVGRFVYSGTMLVREAGEPGDRVDEETAIAPKWAYPKSKAEAEAVIRAEHGAIPYLLLHLAGLYDDGSAVPTLAHQIARIYEKDFKSRFYSGDIRAGQAFIHRDDMMALFRRAVDRRDALPKEAVLVAGEPEAVSYEDLQDRIGALVHGEEEWQTLVVPKPLAKAAAWVEEKAEPLIPDDFDHGEKPFIRPFMIDMSDDHYALDISRARKLLGWKPERSILETLPKLVGSLKDDPLGWYERNGLTPPDWMKAAEAKEEDPEGLRTRHEAWFRAEHQRSLWAHFANVGLGTWMVTAPPTLGYAGSWLAWSDMASGAALVVLGLLSLSWRLNIARWAVAAVGVWLLAAPLLFWTPSAAAYLNGTLVGTLAIGFSVLVKPTPGISPVAEFTGPSTPPGWSFNPSAWPQRIPIIVLALVGLYFSRYLAAYQLGHIDGAWDPFFSGYTDPAKNGTEDIVTSSVSEAFPVPDAGLGALVYLMEILTGVMGSQRRWRTMPWLVALFGFLIVPLGAVSILFIIIQPIMLGTWCLLCLIGAAAMLVQIPYSLDELAATAEFLKRRKKAGAPVLKIFFTGDTDEGGPEREEPPQFERGPAEILRDCVGGGVALTWNLALSILIGLWLLFTRLTVGAEGGMADADHLIGALVITASVIALSEIGRAARYANIPLGAALILAPLFLSAPAASVVSSLVCGALLIALAFRLGPVNERWGTMQRFIR